MTLMQRRRALMAQAKAGGKSDMNGWTDGVAYTDLEIVKDSYWSAANKRIDSYSGWDRTGYVPCDGASSITFPAMPQTSGSVNSNGFFNSAKVWVSQLVLERKTEKTVTVPSNAAYFMISSNSSALASCVNAGIVPRK